MVIHKLLIIFVSLLLFGCVANTAATQKAALTTPDFKKTAASQLLPPPPPVVKKEVVQYDPLDDIFITIDAVNENLSSVLYMIASESGLNLIISPSINVTQPFTITVNNMPARDVLDVICESTGVYYILDGNALKIVSTVTKTFKLPYIRTQTTQESKVGGDVFGDSESNLSGDFSLSYVTSADESNVYNQIENDLSKILYTVSSSSSTSSSESSTTSDTTSSTTQTSSTSDSEESSTVSDGSSYVFNRFTGVLKVTTTPAKMSQVEGYMKDVMSELNKQVLIEAKLVEVTLNDTSAYGIDWSGALDNNPGIVNLGTSNFSVGDSFVGYLSGTGSTFNSSWVLSFIASQGRVESVGNPRIRVMNGQSAMISSGQLIPYWELDRETDDETGDITITTTRVTVLNGIMMGVTAHIREDDTITLNVVPVYSEVSGEQSMTYNGQELARYPVINLKEAGTMLNVKSGDTIVMGGLISNVETEEESKVPLLGDIPVLGYLFKSKYMAKEKRELVIFLTATIINGQG
jgi:MSHA biogenesis protein MshL